MSTVEEIAGYKVHPAASLFPLIDGDEFDSLVESIGNNGIQHPIFVRRSPDGDELIDGRNRLRAAQVARERGYVVDIPVTDWKEDGRNIAEWIWDTNALRRHLTEDAWVLASASITQMIRAENDERQKAAQFTKGTSGNPSGKQVTTKTESPAPRDRKESNARSTAGQVAAKAGVSMHKARQAIAVIDGVEAGTVTPEAVAEVKAGKKKLRDVVPSVASEEPKPKRSPSTKSANNAAWQRIFKGMVAVRNGCKVLAGNQSKRREQVAKELRTVANHVERDRRLKDDTPEQATRDDPALMLDEISYYATAFLAACPEKAGDLETLLLTWISHCKQK